MRDKAEASQLFGRESTLGGIDFGHGVLSDVAVPDEPVDQLGLAALSRYLPPGG